MGIVFGTMFGEVWEGSGCLGRTQGGRTTVVVARGTRPGKSDGQLCWGCVFPLEISSWVLMNNED